MTSHGKFVAYYRVSTKRQGRSGLGLAAQRQAVETYLNGGKWKIVGEFTEHESGKRADRPQLDAALAAARLHRCPLVVSKVDRLTRSVAFLSRLLEAGVDVRFADLPQIEGVAGRFMLTQMAAVAELEAGFISSRTKQALARSTKQLGGDRGQIPSKRAHKAAAEAIQARVAARAADLAPTVRRLQEGGATSLRAIAAGLNGEGISTARGGTWNAAQIARLLEQMGRQ
ncbi:MULTISPECIES: recombinase family protein [unclassified Bradyrhizobium]|uniref:recombinase family protein n=1 Tax=unclassified Bradyrhizobium TaxID=2631580 RepID=UPI003396A654